MVIMFLAVVRGSFQSAHLTYEQIATNGTPNCPHASARYHTRLSQGTRLAVKAACAPQDFGARALRAAFGWP